MALALQEERVLLTADKDFGELVFVRKLPHGPIVRLIQMTVDEQIGAIADLIEHHAPELAGPVMISVAQPRIEFADKKSALL